MKKTLISAVILTALLTTGCQDKELQNKILEQDKVINQLMTEKKNLQEELVAAQTKAEQAIPTIFAQPEVLFKKTENLKPTPDSMTDNPSVNYDISTLKTNIDWLDELLVQEIISQSNSLQTKQQFIESLNKDFDEEVKESGGNYSVEYMMETNFVGQKENIATFEQSSYGYSGGAHGIEGSYYFNVDLKNHKVLRLSDLFAEQNQKQVLELLWDAYVNNSEGEPFIQKANLSISKSFYFTQDALHFVYQPYAIGPYAEGIKELSLSWQALSDLLKPEFKALLQGK